MMTKLTPLSDFIPMDFVPGVDRERHCQWVMSCNEAAMSARWARFHADRRELSAARFQQFKAAHWAKRARDIRDGMPLHLLTPMSVSLTGLRAA